MFSTTTAATTTTATATATASTAQRQPLYRRKSSVECIARRWHITFEESLLLCAQFEYQQSPEKQEEPAPAPVPQPRRRGSRMFPAAAAAAVCQEDEPTFCDPSSLRAQVDAMDLD